MLAEKIDSTVKTAVALNEEITALLNRRPQLEESIRHVEARRDMLKIAGRDPDAELKALHEEKAEIQTAIHSKRAEARKLVSEMREEFIQAVNVELNRIVEEELRPALEGVARLAAAQAAARLKAAEFENPLSRLTAVIEHYGEGTPKLPASASLKRALAAIPSAAEFLNSVRAELDKARASAA